jgi:GIY-YIG catalytic domain
LQATTSGNTGGSTFRLTLASSLFEKMAWQPVMTDRPVLTRKDNRALTEWQHEHLRLTWAVYPEPWTIEHKVIERLRPPLNLAGSTHEFGGTLSTARRPVQGSGRSYV